MGKRVLFGRQKERHITSRLDEHNSTTVLFGSDESTYYTGMYLLAPLIYLFLTVYVAFSSMNFMTAEPVLSCFLRFLQQIEHPCSLNRDQP